MLLLFLQKQQRLPLLAVVTFILYFQYTHSKRILVTGGAGFVGSHVAQYLLSRGDQVVVIDEVNDYYDVTIKQKNLKLLRTHPNATSENYAFYQGDICDTDFLDTIFHQYPTFDAVCHMAARAGVRPSILDPFVYVHSNIRGTVTLMEYAVRYEIPNFVFASSSSVYGGSTSTYFSEDQPVDHPISPYAASKKSCELFAVMYALDRNLPVTGLRFFTVYGPRGRPDMAPFKFIDRVSRNRPIQRYGDGSSSRDYTYIADIVNGVVRAVDRPSAYDVFNLGKGAGTKLSDFLDMVQEYVGRPAQIEELPDQPGDVPYTCANVTHARERLGYQARVPFDVGIRQTVEWYQTDYAPRAVAREQQQRRRLVWDDDDDDDTDGRVPRRRRRQLSPVYPVLEPKRVLVTGGAGFLGLHVVRALLERGDTVVLVDKVANTDLEELWNEHRQSGNLSIHYGDLVDPEFIQGVFEKEQPEWICHMAALTNQTESIERPVDYIRTNIEGTLRLLELSKGSQHGGYNVRNFIVASSSDVYGSREQPPPSTNAVFRHEDDRVDFPRTPYAASKKTAELLAFTYHHLYQIPVSALRFFHVYGPQYGANTEVFKIVDRVFQGKLESSNTFVHQDYTYVGDAVKGILAALDRPHPYEIFNIGSGKCEDEDASDILNIMVDLLPDTSEDVVNDLLFEIEAVMSTQGISCADVDKARSLLGYEPTVPLVQGVRETVAWHRRKFYPDRDLVLPSSALPPQEARPEDHFFAVIPYRMEVFTLLQWFLIACLLSGRLCTSKRPGRRSSE